MRPRRVLLLAAFAASASGALAKETPQPAQESVVVTGSRLTVASESLPRNVTVIGRDEIQRASPARIEDVLSRLTGVHVDQPGRAGGFASLYLRGAESSHLLIMLDGVKLNDPTTTRGSAYDLSAIDVNQIERIEVLRGPASAIYGGEALAGVLNIVTRRQRQGLSAGSYASIGTDDYRRLGGNVAFGRGAVHASGSVGRSENGGSRDDGALRLTSASGALGFSSGDTFSGEVFAQRVEHEGRAFPDDSGGSRLAVSREMSRRDGTALVYGMTIAGGDPQALRVQASVSMFDRAERSDNAGVEAGVRFPVPAFISRTDFRRRSAMLTATRDYGTAFSFIAGVERETEEGSLSSAGDFAGLGSPQTLQFRLDRQIEAFFLESRMRVTPAVTAQLGVRRDAVEGAGEQTTPHFGIAWDLPNGATVLRATANEGFKAPSFFALGFPVGANPDLRPERSRSVEITGTHRLDAAASSVQVSAFRTRFQDLVDFDGATFTNVNRGAIVVEGLELALKLDPARRCRTVLAVTLLDIDVRDGLQPLRNRPEQMASASAACDVTGNSEVLVASRHVGSSLDRSNPTGDIRMPAFTTFDVGYAVGRGAWRVNISIENVFNRYYEQFVGFPAQDRRLRVDLRSRFR